MVTDIELDNIINQCDVRIDCRNKRLTVVPSRARIDCVIQNFATLPNFMLMNVTRFYF